MNRSVQHRCLSFRNDSSSPRDRVLKVACQVFARRGFDGTHIREICGLAGVNIAALCYHFRSKEGLYAAVQAEARQRLSGALPAAVNDRDCLTPLERLRVAIRFLFAKLSANSAWVAHLLARELADTSCTARGMVGDALRPHQVLIESIIRDAAGHGIHPDSLRLSAITVLSQCVFFCAASTALPRIFPQMPARALRPDALVSHLCQSSIRGLAACASAPRNAFAMTPTSRHRSPVAPPAAAYS